MIKNGGVTASVYASTAADVCAHQSPLLPTVVYIPPPKEDLLLIVVNHAHLDLLCDSTCGKDQRFHCALYYIQHSRLSFGRTLLLCACAVLL